MDNLTKLKQEFDALKGQHVLSGDRVHRFIGLVDDGEDYYYCLYDGRKLQLSSCVGRITPLKGYIIDSHYAEMLRIARLNDWDQRSLHLNSSNSEAHKQELICNLGEKDVFIAGPYWELE